MSVVGTFPRLATLLLQWVPYMATLMLGYILLNFGKFDTVPASLPLIVVCFVVSDLTISMIIHHMSKVCSATHQIEGTVELLLLQMVLLR